MYCVLPIPMAVALSSRHTCLLLCPPDIPIVVALSPRHTCVCGFVLKTYLSVALSSRHTCVCCFVLQTYLCLLLCPQDIPVSVALSPRHTCVCCFVPKASIPMAIALSSRHTCGCCFIPQTYLWLLLCPPDIPMAVALSSRHTCGCCFVPQTYLWLLLCSPDIPVAVALSPRHTYSCCFVLLHLFLPFLQCQSLAFLLLLLQQLQVALLQFLPCPLDHPVEHVVGDLGLALTQLCKGLGCEGNGQTEDWFLTTGHSIHSRSKVRQLLTTRQRCLNLNQPLPQNFCRFPHWSTSIQHAISFTHAICRRREGHARNVLNVCKK